VFAKHERASLVLFFPLASFFFNKTFSKLQKQIQAITVTQLENYKQSTLQTKFAIGNIVVLHCENEKLLSSYLLRAKYHMQRFASNQNSC